MQIFGIELMGSQIILSAIVLFILIKTFKSYRKKQMSSSFSIVWCLFWCAVLFVIYYPGFLSSIASMLGIGRGVDLAIYVSVICLFYLVYKLFIKIQSLERQITLLVRKLAVKKVKGAK